MLWTAYLNGRVTPRGEDFVRTVKEIAARVGVDTTPIGMPGQPDRRAALLGDFFALCQEELLATRGESARKYLVEQRGLPAEAIGESSLGVVSTRAQLESSILGRELTSLSAAVAGPVSWLRPTPSYTTLRHVTQRDWRSLRCDRPPTAQVNPDSSHRATCENARNAQKRQISAVWNTSFVS
jgi:hypothetical protein